MFQLRREHLEVLDRFAERDFERRMAEHLIQHRPDKFGGLSREARLTFVRKGISEAEAYGFKKEGAYQRYLELLADYGEQLEEQGVGRIARPILEREEPHGKGKMTLIEIELGNRGITPAGAGSRGAGAP